MPLKRKPLNKQQDINVKNQPVPHSPSWAESKVWGLLRYWRASPYGRRPLCRLWFPVAPECTPAAACPACCATCESPLYSSPSATLLIDSQVSETSAPDLEDKERDERRKMSWTIPRKCSQWLYLMNCYKCNTLTVYKVVPISPTSWNIKFALYFYFKKYLRPPLVWT